MPKPLTIIPIGTDLPVIFDIGLSLETPGYVGASGAVLFIQGWEVTGFNQLPQIITTYASGYLNPSAIPNGGQAVNVVHKAFDGTDYFNASFYVVSAAETWTSSAHGNSWRFFNVAVGATAAREALRLVPSVTADDVSIAIFDITAAALKQVSRGIADSGGAGFRLLRIPN